ncbi:MAG: DUF559 domain-containing protein [Microbacterium arborescens]
MATTSWLGRGSSPAVSTALEHGITPGRLRSGDLERPFRGVRVAAATAPAADEPDADDVGGRARAHRRVVRGRARAYALVMPDGAFFTGRTAAVLHGAPLDASGPLDVGVLAPARAPRARGVRGVSVAPPFVVVDRRGSEGLPVADAATTWAALGRDLDVRRLVVVGDAFVRHPRGPGGVLRPADALTTIDGLAATLSAGPRRGAARLRAALGRIRVGSSSPLESELRLDLADAGAPTPLLDVDIRDDRGRLLGISEFVFEQARVIVEVEGDHHRTSRRQWNRDLDKYAAYAAAGWEVVRVTGTHIRTGHAVPRVRAALQRRTGRTNSSSTVAFPT